jgi:predicted dehydrogenase
MRLFWHDSTLEVPCYSQVHGGRLIRVESAQPLLKITDASGRVYGRPWRKVAAFVKVDGPLATFRKARSKLREHRYSGDYHVVLVLGTCVETDARVAALSCRAPKRADYMVTHEDLIGAVPDGFDSATLRDVAASLLGAREDLEAAGRETYVYSAQAPPGKLVSLFGNALRGHLPPPQELRRRQSNPAGSGPSKCSDVPNDVVCKSPARTIRHGMGIVLLGAGDYARTEILPHLRGSRWNLFSLADREPQIASLVAEEFHFGLATTNPYAAIDALPEPGLVIVATYHDSHARLASYALANGHRVLLEKPAAACEEDLDLLLEARRGAEDRLELGFNRRYHPLVQRARSVLGSERGPTTITCIVREVNLQSDHWYFWPNQGTRITGNLCHWIDLGIYLLHDDPLPLAVQASEAQQGARVDTERVLSVPFSDGSLLTIVATEQGDGTRGVQEWIQIQRGSVTATLDDLFRLRIMRRGKSHAKRTIWRHKGHRHMYRAALGRALQGGASPYRGRDLVIVTEIHLAGARLITQGELYASLSERVQRRLAQLKALPCDGISASRAPSVCEDDSGSPIDAHSSPPATVQT